MFLSIKSSAKVNHPYWSVVVALAIPLVFFAFGFLGNSSQANGVFSLSKVKQNFYSGEQPFKTLSTSPFNASLLKSASEQTQQSTDFDFDVTPLEKIVTATPQINIASLSQRVLYTSFLDETPIQPKSAVRSLTSTLFATKTQTRLDRTQQRPRFLCFPASDCDTKT